MFFRVLQRDLSDRVNMVFWPIPPSITSMSKIISKSKVELAYMVTMLSPWYFESNISPENKVIQQKLHCLTFQTSPVAKWLENMSLTCWENTLTCFQFIFLVVFAAITSQHFGWSPSTLFFQLPQSHKEGWRWSTRILGSYGGKNVEKRCIENRWEYWN